MALEYRLDKRAVIARAYRAFAKRHLALNPGTPVYPAWEAMLKEEFGAVQWGKDLLFPDENKAMLFALNLS